MFPLEGYAAPKFHPKYYIIAHGPMNQQKLHVAHPCSPYKLYFVARCAGYLWSSFGLYYPYRRITLELEGVVRESLNPFVFLAIRQWQADAEVILLLVAALLQIC